MFQESYSFSKAVQCTALFYLFDKGQKQIAGVDTVACGNINLVDNTVLFGHHCCFHLHGFDDEQRLILCYLVTFFDEYLTDGARNRGAYMSRISLVSLQLPVGLDLDRKSVV